MDAVAFTWFKSAKELSSIREKYPTVSKFSEKFWHACYYSLRYKENASILGSLRAESSLFPMVIDWIHKQSNNNIQINILAEEDELVNNFGRTSHYLFTMKVSKSYKEPLTRYITYYLALVTLRMVSQAEGYYKNLGRVEEFTAHTLNALNIASGNGYLNRGHALYRFNAGDSVVVFPTAVLEKLFKVRFFNKVFGKPFKEYYVTTRDMLEEVSLNRKVSQTACIMKMCREAKLLHKLQYRGFNGRGKNKKVWEDFDFILNEDTGRVVKLNLIDPLYTPIEEKLKLAKEKK